MEQNATQWIGWAASAVLVFTLASQLRAQYKARSSEGVSAGLYVGQILASAGFAVYSFLISNWVFVVTNVALLIAAVGGAVLWRRFAKADGARQPAAERASAPDGISIPDVPDPAALPSPAEASMGGRRWTFDGLRRRLTGVRPKPSGAKWG